MGAGELFAPDQRQVGVLEVVDAVAGSQISALPLADDLALVDEGDDAQAVDRRQADHRLAGLDPGDILLGQGDFGGYMDLDEGTDLIYIPVSQLNGWILGGLSGSHPLSGPPNPSIPAGYDHQVTGQCRRPTATPTTHKTWGAIKALYR